MKITDVTPKVERVFSIEFTEDEAEKLLALLGSQAAFDNHLALHGYDALKKALGVEVQKYSVRPSGNSYRIARR